SSVTPASTFPDVYPVLCQQEAKVSVVGIEEPHAYADLLRRRVKVEIGVNVERVPSQCGYALRFRCVPCCGLQAEVEGLAGDRSHYATVPGGWTLTGWHCREVAYQAQVDWAIRGVSPATS